VTCQSLLHPQKHDFHVVKTTVFWCVVFEVMLDFGTKLVVLQFSGVHDKLRSLSDDTYGYAAIVWKFYNILLLSRLQLRIFLLRTFMVNVLSKDLLFRRPVNVNVLFCNVYAVLLRYFI
jgi:hypothetical protein